MPGTGVHGAGLEKYPDEMISMKFHSTPARSGSPVFLCEPPYHLHFGGVHNRAWSVGPQLLGVYVRPAFHSDHAQERSPEQNGHDTDRECLLVPTWKLLAMLNRYGSEDKCEPEVGSSPKRSRRVKYISRDSPEAAVQQL
jgi:hypothetical protein